MEEQPLLPPLDPPLGAPSLGNINLKRQLNVNDKPMKLRFTSKIGS